MSGLLRSGLSATATLVVAAWLASGCASSASRASPGDTASASGVVRVSGQVPAEPGCPGPAMLGSPRPVPGAAVEVEQNGQRIAGATAATGGFFQSRLAPGAYRIVATAPAPLKSTASKNITVGAVPVSVDLTVDSVMR